jgi:ABC-type dipeptide/oligopeptide/nickel transport system permease component
VRLLAALGLPVVVPGIIAALIFALPGDPAEIICPPEMCAGTADLAQRWNLDGGPWQFYTGWVSSALRGDFGSSWRVLQGEPVSNLLAEAVPTTVVLLLAGMLPVAIAAIAGASGRVPRRIVPAFAAFGLVPAVVLALLGAAAVELRFGADSFDVTGTRVRILVGALVLGLADGAFSDTLSGVGALFSGERKQRYVQVAQLRGERPLSNMLPNLTPALVGQLRARALQLVSGTVVVEVVLRINGVGDLLWNGTLLQDFGVVIAAATTYAVLSAVLLAVQAVVEIAVALWVRRAPAAVRVEGVV